MADPLIVRLANEFREQLLQREAASVAEMSKRWLAVEAALSDQALRLAQEVADLRAAGEMIGPGKLYRLQRYQQLLAQTQAQLARFNQTATNQIEAAALQNAAQGIQDAIALIQTASGTEVIAFARLNVEAAERVAALARAGQPLGAIIERSYPLAVEGITNRLLTGIALGVNPRETARRMVQEGLAEGLNHILLVARDQQIRAYREGGRQQYLTSGMVLRYRRHAAKQPGRTCLACIALDGTEYDTSELMPLHPQDRCAMIPVVEGLPNVEWTSGEAYFKSLPPEVQADWLGPGRWELWQEGRLPFEKLVTIKENEVWGASAQVTSLKDLLKGN